MDRKVRGVEDIELLSSIPIYGLLPDKNKSDNIFHESLRRVRANIQFIAPEWEKSYKTSNLIRHCRRREEQL